MQQAQLHIEKMQEPLQSSIACCDSIEEMSRIFSENVNVVVYKRAMSEAVKKEILTLGQASMVQHSMRSGPGLQAKDTIQLTLPDAPALVDDICHWVDVMADMTGCDEVGIRLACLDKQMCPKFHVDYVALRMVITYDGTTTEFIDNKHVERRLVDSGLADGSTYIRPSNVDENHIQRANVGDVVLMKGELWPKNEGNGAVHRSPHADPEHPRIVLTLDPVWNT